MKNFTNSSNSKKNFNNESSEYSATFSLLENAKNFICDSYKICKNSIINNSEFYAMLIIILIFLYKI